MGREIKRVALDFDWELNKVWHGYINPYYQFEESCSHCEGTGDSQLKRALESAWYNHEGSAGIILAERAENHISKPLVLEFCGRFEYDLFTELRNTTHQWVYNLEQCDVDVLWENERLGNFGEKPTVGQVNAWSRTGLGHDAINRMIVIKNRCEMWDIDPECPICNGSGEQWQNNGYKHLAESFENIEPPAGEGWQLWENVTEGSPISPVFETEMAFEEYLLKQGYSVTAVKNFIEQGFSFSMVMTGDGRLLNDIESTNLDEDSDERFDI